MKYILTLALTLSSLGAWAGKDHQEWQKKFDQMSFEDAKKMMQEKAEKKTAMVQNFQTCINEAKDKEALKTCKEEKKEAKQAMKKEFKQKMKKQSQEETLE